VIRVLILGAANIAERSVIPSLLSHGGFTIVGLATKSRYIEVQNRYNFSIYSDYEEALNLVDYDLVYIPLPTGLHYKYIKRALELHKHVWCEKSLAQNYSEIVELVDIAKQNRKVLFESFQFRFHSQIIELKKIVEGGALGKIRLFRSFFGFPPFQDRDNIRYIKKLGGGALLDAGAYPVKVLSEFFEDELEVLSASLNSSEGYEVDLYGSAHLKSLGNGIDIQIAFGFDNFYQNGIEIWGSKGKLFTNRLFTATKDVIPEIELISKEGNTVIKCSGDDHFANMLDHITLLLSNPNIMDKEYSQILRQGKLIDQIKRLSNGK
jgi:dTDP-3,4-didehydro-2,6-dideoxy-alpha-D-glucose 3-reductase